CSGPDGPHWEATAGPRRASPGVPGEAPIVPAPAPPETRPAPVERHPGHEEAQANGIWPQRTSTRRLGDPRRALDPFVRLGAQELQAILTHPRIVDRLASRPGRLRHRTPVH